MTTALIPAPNSSTDEVVRDSHQTTCCVVGGGPGGVMLALLLARQRVPVTLLEQHKDFDREFRGDTIHPSTLELLDQISAWLSRCTNFNTRRSTGPLSV